MFNVRPDKRWFGFYAEPPEDPPGFGLNADGSVRGTLPDDPGSAFPGYDLGVSAAMPGNTMFNVRPELDLPGLHRFKPPQETVPGFRMTADGSIRNDATPAARPGPDVGTSPFGVFDLQSLGANAFTPVGDGSPPPYLIYGPGLYNRLAEAPTLAPDAERRPVRHTLRPRLRSRHSPARHIHPDLALPACRSVRHYRRISPTG